MIAPLGAALLLWFGWGVGLCLWDLDHEAARTQSRTRFVGGPHA